MNNNLDFLDILSVLGFIIGVLNYNENVDQGDMQKAVQDAVNTINKHLEIQDIKLDQIMEVLEIDQNKKISKTDR